MKRRDRKMTLTLLPALLSLSLALGCGVAQPGDEPGGEAVGRHAAALDDGDGDGPDLDPPPPGARPDITLQAVSPLYRTGAVYPGLQPMFLRVRVTNSGTWTTGRSFTLALKTLALSGGLPVNSSVVVSALDVGQSRVVEIPMRDRREMLGIYDFRVTADSLFQVSESNESNNQLYLSEIWFQ